MNPYRLKLNRHYRFGYQQNGSEYIHAATGRFINDKDSIAVFYNKLEELRRNYPDHIFWIEEFNPKTRTWSRLRSNSIYDLFSEDDPQEKEERMTATTEEDIPF